MKLLRYNLTALLIMCLMYSDSVFLGAVIPDSCEDLWEESPVVWDRTGSAGLLLVMWGAERVDKWVCDRCARDIVEETDHLRHFEKKRPQRQRWLLHDMYPAQKSQSCALYREQHQPMVLLHWSERDLRQFQPVFVRLQMDKDITLMQRVARKDEVSKIKH